MYNIVKVYHTMLKYQQELHNLKAKQQHKDATNMSISHRLRTGLRRADGVPTFTRGIWKVMHIHPYNFTQWSEKKDEGISVNVRVWGFWGHHVLMFELMR